MPSPEFPRDESLERWIALVDEGSTSRATERKRVPEGHRLTVVEYIALAVVGRRRAGWLISELRTPLDRKSLICVDESLAERQLHRRRVLCRSLQVHGDESTGHRRIARKEERLTLFQWSSEPIADRIRTEIRTVVADPDDYRSGQLFTCGQEKLLIPIYK